MNQDEIFRKLTRGVKFDRVRYREDAEHLGLVPKAAPKATPKTDPKNTIFVTDMDSTSNVKYEKIENFDTIQKQILGNLTETLHWNSPTRIQMAAIPVLLGTVINLI